MTLTARLLGELDAAPLPLSTAELRRRTGATHESVRGTLRRLETDGVVRRAVVPRPKGQPGSEPTGWAKTD